MFHCHYIRLATLYGLRLPIFSMKWLGYRKKEVTRLFLLKRDADVYIRLFCQMRRDVATLRCDVAKLTRENVTRWQVILTVTPLQKGKSKNKTIQATSLYKIFL